MKENSLFKNNALRWVLFYALSALLVFLVYISFPRTTLNVKDQPKGAFVKIEEVSLARPGFVVLLSEGADIGHGEFLGSSEYLLPGIYKDMNIQIIEEPPKERDSVMVAIYYDDGDMFVGGMEWERIAIGLRGKAIKEIINLY